MTDKMIEKLEAKGFKRWTKNGHDRLYANATSFGLVCEYYKTGNVKNAEFNGESISNCCARRLMSAKIYIDIADGKIYGGSESMMMEAVEAAYEEVKKEIAEEEAAEKAAETKTEEGNDMTTKTIDREEVAKQLIDEASAEFDESGVTYYFYLDGAAFTASATPAHYGYTQEEWDAMESPEAIYDRETLDDPVFSEIVDDITVQVNDYLDEE